MPNRSIDLRTAERDYLIACRHAFNLRAARFELHEKLLSAQDSWQSNFLYDELFQAFFECQTEIFRLLTEKKHRYDAIKYPEIKIQLSSQDYIIIPTPSQMQEMMNSASEAIGSAYVLGTRDSSQLRIIILKTILAAQNHIDAMNEDFSTGGSYDLSSIKSKIQEALNVTRSYIDQFNNYIVETKKELKTLEPIISSLEKSYEKNGDELIKAQQSERSAKAELDFITAKYEEYILAHPDCEVVPMGFYLPIQLTAQPEHEDSADDYLTAPSASFSYQDDSDSDWYDFSQDTPALAVGVEINESAGCPE